MDNRKVAIIDFGMGNLFSVKNVCQLVGLDAVITSSRLEVEAAQAVILPGVGAFGKAMETLQKYDLIDAIKDSVAQGKPFVGICLGLQLLMSESEEFGRHKGLDIIKGSVIRFNNMDDKITRFKVPHVGWSAIRLPSLSITPWAQSMLAAIEPGQYMYFVHSYYVQPSDEKMVLSTTEYGGIQFCSSIQYKNIFACQFHPERSAEQGLAIYKNLAQVLQEKYERKINVRKS